MSGSPGVTGRGIAIKPTIIRIDPVTTRAAWTTLSIHTRYPFLSPSKPPRRFLPWVGSGPRHDIAVSNSFSGPGSRPSGPGFRSSGAGPGSGPFICLPLLHAAQPHLHLCTSLPAPVPEPEDPYLIPDCRELRPEDVLPAT